jgi:fucose 4-O-acetylase-like acetyltransferase
MHITEDKKRDFLFDNLKFIGIILVVFAHLLEGFNTPATDVIYKTIYLFHMPLFIFVSGYYSKFNLKKIVKNLIIPYVIAQTLWSIIEYFVVGSTQNFLLFILAPRWVLWYLLSMIIWRFSTFLLEKLNQKGLVCLLVLAVICGLCVGYGNYDGYLFSISRTLAFYPFFVFGFFCRRVNFKNWKFLYNNIFRFGFLVLSLLSVILFFVLFPNVPRDVLYNSYTYQQLVGYSVWVRIFMYACATIIIFTIIMFADKQFKLGSFIGQNSMVIYLAHAPMVRGLSMLLPASTPAPIFVSIVLTCLLIVISILIGKGWRMLKRYLLKRYQTQTN